jgi:hypothetical protein
MCLLSQKKHYYFVPGLSSFSTFHLKRRLTKDVECITCVRMITIKSVALCLAFCLAKRKILLASTTRQ